MAFHNIFNEMQPQPRSLDVTGFFHLGTVERREQIILRLSRDAIPGICHLE